MMMDGLEDAYEPGKAMGVFAEDAARIYQFTRDQQDEYAIRSLARANMAISSGAFAREIVPVIVPGRGGDMLVDTDEQPGKARPDKTALRLEVRRVGKRWIRTCKYQGAPYK